MTICFFCSKSIKLVKVDYINIFLFTDSKRDTVKVTRQTGGQSLGLKRSRAHRVACEWNTVCGKRQSAFSLVTLQLVCFTDPSKFLTLAKSSFPTTRHIISPADPQLLSPKGKAFFFSLSGVTVLGLCGSLMNWHDIFIFRIILISKRCYWSRLHLNL